MPPLDRFWTGSVLPNYCIYPSYTPHSTRNNDSACDFPSFAWQTESERNLHEIAENIPRGCLRCTASGNNDVNGQGRPCNHPTCLFFNSLPHTSMSSDVNGTQLNEKQDHSGTGTSSTTVPVVSSNGGELERIHTSATVETPAKTVRPPPFSRKL